MQWITYPDGETVSYGYDPGGLVKTAVGKRPATKFYPAATETYLASLLYDEHGQRRYLTLGNGGTTRYDYYPESLRLRALHTEAGGQTLQALSYRYDRVGNVLGMTNALPPPTTLRSGPVSFEFGYDDLYRLTSATGTAQSRAQVVDSFRAAYGYDAIHNMTRNTQVHVIHHIVLASATTSALPGCDPSSYEPQKCPILPGGDPVLNHRFDGTMVRPETYYYHLDHLGSTSWVTDQNGRVHEHVEYFPYGEVWRDVHGDTQGGPVKAQRFLFTGKELDEETGLYYFGARYFDPVRARWTSGDPADRLRSSAPIAALNPYQYALWAPLRLVDPTGLQEQETPRTSLEDYKTVPKVEEFMPKSSKLPKNIQRELADLKRTLWLINNYDKIGEARRREPSVSPIRGDIRITGRFGDVRAIRGNRPHTGADIVNPLDADVLASRDGIVLRTPTPNTCGGSANAVIVQNKDGSLFIYGHTKTLVQPGEPVTMGQVIGRTDLSGITAGPHVITASCRCQN